MFGSAAAHGEVTWLQPGMYVYSMWGVMVVLTVIGFLAGRKRAMVPSGIQNVVEFLIEGLYGFLESMLDEERIKKYFPLLCTFFLYIVTSNYIGLLPGVGHADPEIGALGLFIPPTANLSNTAALAIIVFLSTHVLGIAANGLGYFKHFLTPMWWMLPLNIVEEIVRPVSLAMRLYGNIFGHELVVATLVGMSPWFVPTVMQLLGTLTGAIQAFVFTLLATTYIATATAKHH